MKNSTNITLRDKVYILESQEVKITTLDIIGILEEGSSVKIITRVADLDFDGQSNLLASSELYDEGTNIHYYLDKGPALAKSIERANLRKSRLIGEITLLEELITANELEILKRNES